MSPAPASGDGAGSEGVASTSGALDAFDLAAPAPSPPSEPRGVPALRATAPAGQRRVVVRAAGEPAFDDGTPLVLQSSGQAVGTPVDVRLLSGAAARASSVGFAFRVADEPEAVPSLSVAVDLRRLGLPLTGDLVSRLGLYARSDCESGACAPLRAIRSSIDSEAGVLTAELPPERSATSFVLSTEATGAAGDFSATPFSLVSDYQVGLSTGAAETRYEFGVPKAAAGPEPTVAITYSSVAADGMSASRNNQPGPVGVGWSLESGYISRHLLPCGFANARGERCVYRHDFTITLNGKTTRLVPEAPDPTSQLGPAPLPAGGKRYRLADDPNWRVERLPYEGDRPHPDGRDEYWVVTQPDGVRMRFGGEYEPGTGADQDSVFFTTAYSPEDSRADFCDADAKTATQLCDTAWQWNVDWVEDPNGNAASYFYSQEINHYRGLGDAREGEAYRRAYVRAGHLDRIEYTKRADGSREPNARVRLETARRCTGPCAGPADFPDTPLDLACDATGACDPKWSGTQLR